MTLVASDEAAGEEVTRDRAAARFSLAALAVRVCSTRRTQMRSGRMYYAGFPIVMTPQGPTAVDTFPVLRQRVTSAQADTVAFLRNPPNASEFSTARGGGVAFRINAARPFESSDAWVVFPDGRVVVVRVADYHLDVIAAGGRVTRGAPVRYTPVRVTEAEKREWRESRAGATMIGVTGRSIPLPSRPGWRSGSVIPASRRPDPPPGASHGGHG